MTTGQKTADGMTAESASGVPLKANGFPPIKNNRDEKIYNIIDCHGLFVNGMHK